MDVYKISAALSPKTGMRLALNKKNRRRLRPEKGFAGALSPVCSVNRLQVTRIFYIR
jgi:hypothetical protein